MMVSFLTGTSGGHSPLTRMELIRISWPKASNWTPWDEEEGEGVTIVVDKQHAQPERPVNQELTRPSRTYVLAHPPRRQLGGVMRSIAVTCQTVS